MLKEFVGKEFTQRLGMNPSTIAEPWEEAETRKTVELLFGEEQAVIAIADAKRQL